MMQSDRYTQGQGWSFFVISFPSFPSGSSDRQSEKDSSNKLSPREREREKEGKIFHPRGKELECIRSRGQWMGREASSCVRDY